MGASIAGSVNSVSVGAYGARSASTGLVVRLVGTSIEGVVDGSGHFELANVPDGDAHLQFAGPNVNAFATIDGVTSQEHIEVVVTLTGDTAAVETTDRSTPAEEKISGTVDALAGACPTLTFSLSGSSIIVGPSTIFGGGSSCASVKNGDKRTAVGTRDGSGRLVARYVTGAEPPAPVPTPPPTPTPSPTPPAPPSPAPPAPTTVSGIITGVAGSCPTLTFSVEGTAVTTSQATTYGGGGSCADVKNGDKRYVSGTMQNGKLAASYISGAIPIEATLTGAVSNLSGTCPALTFVVSGKSAKTTSSTAFSPGTCSDVKNGVTVTVVGPTGTDGGVSAARTVSVPKGEPQVTINGIISGLAGACPNLTFMVDTTAAATNSATMYGGGGSCADIKNGDKRYVAGTMQDGKLIASYISGAIAQDVTLSGAVASLSGTCPGLTFSLSGKTVLTTSATTFSPGACGDVKNGVTVTVVGTVGTDGRVTARSVSVPKSDPEVTLNGVIAGLAGACPNLTFTVGGSPVATNSATTYGGGSSCASVKNGEKRYAVGPRQGDGSVLARYISGVVTP